MLRLAINGVTLSVKYLHKAKVGKPTTTEDLCLQTCASITQGEKSSDHSKHPTAQLRLVNAFESPERSKLNFCVCAVVCPKS